MEDKSFVPNIQWMSEKYDEMNEKLFGGSLGKCSFGVFTTGKGSQGRVLGWFKITKKGVKVDRYTRRMYALEDWFDKVYIDKNNFVEKCWPKIELNGNYSGTENGFLATLVHEMCHYYTYMNGFAPKQGHGPEFREIGMAVSNRSNGMFTIQRLASAEQMNDLVLNDKMQAINDKRIENKKSAITAVFRFKTNGDIQLTTTSNNNLIKMIVKDHERKDVLKVVTSNDRDLIEILFAHGYRKNMRTWRYWNVQNESWINRLNDYTVEEYPNPMYSKEEAQQPESTKKYMFLIKTNNGIKNIEYNGSQEDLKNKLKNAFANMKDEALEKIMSNKANYKVSESINNNNKISKIIKETINEFMEDEFGDKAKNHDDDIEISPYMNLGLFSPLEMEEM